ncbi:MAG TPA: glycosyltransferase family 4 protein [Longimicrobiales bacterium]|nr:glycosyltransferase family 4 protein [Longimicrobiales bacterium]
MPDPADTQAAVFLFSQVYRPDPAAVGQYLAALGRALAERGVPVRVFTAHRGYDDPAVRYPARENLEGVDVVRFRGVSFGKESTMLRLAAALSFCAQSVLRAVRIPPGSIVVVSTTPPFVAAFLALLARLRGYRLVYWVMDLNPDQLVALGRLRRHSLFGRVLAWMNAQAVNRADTVIALDAFMYERLRAYGATPTKSRVIGLWPMASSAATATAGQAFRREHGLEQQFVVMYSGNHTMSNPLDTLLEAARELVGHTDIRFVFVGGGTAKPALASFVDRHGLANTLLLPYQPLERLEESLAAADLHVVTMGEGMVGVIHPSKVYSALGVGRPVLYIGPEPSHVSEILDRHEVGWSVPHGDCAGAIRAILAAYRLSEAERDAMGRRGLAVVQSGFSEEVLLGRIVDLVESLRAPRTRPSPVT